MGELENSGGKKVRRDRFILIRLILSDDKKMELMTEIGFGEEENARMEIYWRTEQKSCWAWKVSQNYQAWKLFASYSFFLMGLSPFKKVMVGFEPLQQYSGLKKYL